MPECQVPHWAEPALHPGDLLGRHHLHLPRQPGWEKTMRANKIFCEVLRAEHICWRARCCPRASWSWRSSRWFQTELIIGEKSTVKYFIEGSAAIGLRVGTCVAYAIVVMGLLWLDKTELLGILLGIVMCGMVSILPLIYWLAITIILWRHI